MKQRVVLFESRTDYVGVPWSLLRTSCGLDSSKYEVVIVTARDYPDYEKALMDFCDGALCLGITAIISSHLRTALRVSRIIKRSYPRLRIVWGGWAGITIPDVILKEPSVDFICTGQGERTLPSVVEGVPANFPFEDINNFPDPDLDLINWDNHLIPERWGIRRCLNILTSVGCPYRCGFCCEQKFCGRKWYGLSAERTLSLLCRIHDRCDFDAIRIEDSNFYVNERRVADICKGIIDSGMNVKLINTNGRSDTLAKYSAETWALMREAGLKNILIGVESVDRATLKLIDKDEDIEDTARALRFCNEYGIIPFLSCVLGFPSERYRSGDADSALQEEVNGLFEFYRNVYLTITAEAALLVFFYTPYPGSPLYSAAIDMGFKPPETVEEWADMILTNSNMPWLEDVSFKTMDRIRMFGYLCRFFSCGYDSFLDQLPPLFRIVGKMVVSMFGAIARLRLKRRWLSWPADRMIVTWIETMFRRYNAKKKMIGISNEYI